MLVFNAKSEIGHPYHTKRLFFSAATAQKASEIDPREALDLILG